MIKDMINIDKDYFEDVLSERKALSTSNHFDYVWLSAFLAVAYK